MFNCERCWCLLEPEDACRDEWGTIRCYRCHRIFLTGRAAYEANKALMRELNLTAR